MKLSYLMVFFVGISHNGCQKLIGDFQSETAAEGDENCSGSIEKLDVNCLLEIFKYLPDIEIVRNLRLLSQKNPTLKQALARVAESEIPVWRKNQIKQDVQNTLNSAQSSDQMRTMADLGSAVKARIDEELIRNYVEFVKLINSEVIRRRTPAAFQAPSWEPLAKFSGEKGTSFSVSSNKDTLSLIGEHRFVYQRKDGKIVGIDLTTGREVFTYDNGGLQVTAFVSLNDQMFLSAQVEGSGSANTKRSVYLWPSKPSRSTVQQKPLKVFYPQNDSKNGSGVTSLVAMGPDTFVALSNHFADVFSTSRSSEPMASLSGNFIKYRLKKMTAEEMFLLPEDPISSWVPEFWRINSNQTTKMQAIALPEKTSYRFDVVAKNKILVMKNDKCHGPYQVHLFNKDDRSYELLGTFRDRWNLLPNGLVEISGNVYKFWETNRPLITAARGLPFFKISSDAFISGYYGSLEYPILSWKKSLQLIGQAKNLWTTDHQYYIVKTTEQGELVLSDDRAILVVNLWANIAKNLGR